MYMRMKWLGFATNLGGIGNLYEIQFRKFDSKKLYGKIDRLACDREDP
jgi:hypothetical protein